MLNRSRACHALSVLFAAACLLALPTAAPAAGPAALPVPADAPTVATTPSGDALIAWVAGGRTCMVLQKAGAPRPATLIDGTAVTAERGTVEENGLCRSIRAQSRFHAELLHASGDARGKLAWGVAGAGAARIQLREACATGTPWTPRRSR